MTDPQTPAEWQEAVDAAAFLLLLDSAIQYGLIATIGRDPDTINGDRCVDILHRGAQQGIYPSDPQARRRAIGNWLRRERAALGLTQQALGRACGISQQWVQRIEAGTHPIRDDTLARLRGGIAELKARQA